MTENKQIRIAITGPESTGKSELTMRLARHYKAPWVAEYARDYIAALDRPYNYHDILIIARQQMKLFRDSQKEADRLLFCDTELLVTKIWCEFKYGRCHDWILEQLGEQQFDLYLLTNIDLPWQEDPQREHPDRRSELFNLYLHELQQRSLPFEIISGVGEARLQNAVRYIESRFKIF